MGNNTLLIILIVESKPPEYAYLCKVVWEKGKGEKTGRLNGIQTLDKKMFHKTVLNS